MQKKYTEKSHLLSGREQKKYGSELRITIQSPLLYELPTELLIHILRFLSKKDFNKFSQTSRNFYNINQEFLNVRHLYHMVSEIEKKNVTMLSRDTLCTRILLQLMLFAITALLAWGSYEVTKYADSNHPNDDGWHGWNDMMLHVLAILLGEAGLASAFTAMFLPWWSYDEKVRPSQAIGNLKKIIRTYNDIFPNNQLGIDEISDAEMTSNEYIQLFQLGIKQITHQINLGQRTFRYEEGRNFFFNHPTKKLTSIESAAGAMEMNSSVAKTFESEKRVYSSRQD